MNFVPSPTKVVAFINKEGARKLIPMNRAARRKLQRRLQNHQERMGKRAALHSQ